MARQYVAVKFNLSGRQSYTYHNDGKPAAPGDIAKVPARHGDGWQRAHVVHVTDLEQEFTTKPILGLVEPDAPAQGDLLGGTNG